MEVAEQTILNPALRVLTRELLLTGGHASAALHMARSICRRAERAVVPMTLEGSLEAAVAIYLNRLSDYLFTAARLAVR